MGRNIFDKYEDEQAQLSLKVKQIFDDSEQRFGAEKIRIVLAQNGIHVSKNRVVSIMQELDLYSIRVDAKKLHKKDSSMQKKKIFNYPSNCPRSAPLTHKARHTTVSLDKPF